MSTLVESMKSYHDFLIGMQQRTAENHFRKEHFKESFGYREIDGKTGPVSPIYHCKMSYCQGIFMKHTALLTSILMIAINEGCGMRTYS